MTLHPGVATADTGLTPAQHPTAPRGVGPPRLRILAADSDPGAPEFYQSALGRCGHEVAVVRTGRQLQELALHTRPDLVVLDVPPSPAEEAEAILPLGGTTPMPLIVVCDGPAADVLDGVRCGLVMACLRKPLREDHLPVAVTLAWRQFELFQALQQEAAALREALQERKLVEQAKGVVMRRVVSDEQEAFRRLHHFARDHNVKLARAAELVLQAEQAFAALEGPAAPRGGCFGSRPRRAPGRLR